MHFNLSQSQTKDIMAKRKYINDDPSSSSSSLDDRATKVEKKRRVSSNAHLALVASIDQALGQAALRFYRVQWKHAKKAGHHKVLKTLKLRTRKRKASNVTICELKAALSWALKRCDTNFCCVLVLSIVQYLNKFEGAFGTSVECWWRTSVGRQ